jgi:hypothetical protein
MPPKYICDDVWLVNIGSVIALHKPRDVWRQRMTEFSLRNDAKGGLWERWTGFRLPSAVICAVGMGRRERLFPMARKEIILLTDDLDGQSEAQHSVDFSVDGTAYRIDLNEKNHTAFRKVLSKYVDVATKVGKVASTSTQQKVVALPARKAKGRSVHSREQTDAIRAWARSKKLAVSDRGRIPAEIIRQFNDAH